jgi:alpha-glucosidase
MLKLRLVWGTISAVLLCTSAASAAMIESPDKHIRLALSVNTHGALEYAVTLNGKSVIEPSPVGITVDGANLAQGVTIGKSQTHAAMNCTESIVPVRHGKTKTDYRLTLMACNDGIAFRHQVPGARTRVPDEATAFRPPAGSTVWYHDLEGHYEAHHVKKALAEVPAGQWAAPPMTIQLPGDIGYAAITESALAHYAGMALQADGQGGFAARLGHAHPPSYPFRLRYKEDVERLKVPAAITGPITTPWRVVMIGVDLNALVNSNIVNTLAPPPDPVLFPQGAKTAWIRPGRAVWKYLDGGENTIETVREFSKEAAALGFEYQVVEGFWSRWSIDELKAVIAESRAQGVGLWLWKHSKELRTPESRKAFFDLCTEVGAAGVKIDFFDHEAKEVVDQYEILLRAAAEHKLLVNFHGANKPTGESRTWPNELTREAVRGMESSKSMRAQHDTTIPFTRLLAGPADYTPMHFGARRNDTTWAHQIASAAIFTSPLLTFAANPKSILENPAVEVIKSIPAVWDETVVLPGSAIGEAAVFARRKGNTWFLAVLNGTTPRNLKLNLSFLGSGDYQGLLVRDTAANDGSVKMENAKLNKSSALEIDMLAGGGFIARFSK